MHFDLINNESNPFINRFNGSNRSGIEFVELGLPNRSNSRVKFRIIKVAQLRVFPFL